MGFFQFRGSRGGLFSNVSMGEFCSIRIAPINRDLRDMVDVFPFFERRLTRRTYIVFLCLAPLNSEGQRSVFNRGVLRDFVVHFKQRGILNIARFFKGLKVIVCQHFDIHAETETFLPTSEIHALDHTGNRISKTQR